MRDKQVTTWFAFVLIVWLVLVVAMGYVGYHFIAKYW